jgi:hypothetical protein
MNTAMGSAARRELALVIALAVFGVALVLVVAFAPWYEPMMARTGGVSVVQTIPPAQAADVVPVGATVLIETR